MTLPLREPVLAEALRLILPNETQTELLRACLLSGNLGRRAWEAWCRRTGDPKATFERDQTGLKGLLPLVETALRRNGVGIDGPLRSYLRAAHVYEQLRNKAYREICGRVLMAFAAENLPVVALRACVVAETVYETPAVRHCHAIDFLVHDGDLARAAEILEQQKFARAKAQPAPNLHHVTYLHQTGLPVELHARLTYIRRYVLPLDKMWVRSRSHTIAGTVARILSPGDNLLHICGHAAGVRGRANLRWACDAWLIIDQHPDLDWQEFLDCATSSGLALPLFVMLRYLADELEAPVPPHVPAVLAEAAERDGSQGEEAALQGALTGLSAAMRALFREASGWHTRARLLRFILLPSPACMGWTYHIPHRSLLPFYYLYRPVQYAVTRLARLILSTPSTESE